MNPRLGGQPLSDRQREAILKRRRYLFRAFADVLCRHLSESIQIHLMLFFGSALSL